MFVHFATPVALVLLGLLVPVVLWVRRSLAGLGKVRGAVALALRLAITLLLVLALARLQWSMTQDDLSVIYVLDRSLSIPAEAQKQALEFVRQSQQARRPSDTAGLVVFGRSAALERPAEALPLLEQPAAAGAGGPAATTGGEQPTTETGGGEKAPGEVATLQSVVATERTNIASALRLALGAFPPSGRQRIVLISDGNENLGAATEEAEAARRNSVRVDVLPIHYRYEQEVMVEKVLAPANVDRGEAFEVRTVAWSSAAQPARLHLYENGTLVGSTEVQLKEGRNVFVVERKLPEPGYYSYSATVEAGQDTLYANNSGSAFSLVRGEGRVLYLEGDAGHAQELLGALSGQGLAVRLAGLEALPLSLGQLIPYDTVILSGVPASSLGEEGMRVLELAVKDWGVGLVALGSENSFGPGGYQDSPLERALPVSMDIKQRRVMPSGALVIILHTCEIPEGNYWAQQIALAALRVLSPTDEFGAIYYDWQANEQWLFPLQRVADKTSLAQRIAGVAPGDMPSFITSLEMAHRALKASSASIKHVVVISDGDPAYPNDTAVLNMVADGVTLSTVAISPHGQTDTARLAHVAQLGKGRYYEPQSPGELPEIFIKEAATVRRSLICEEAFTPKAVLASELTTGISPAEYPPLGGYVCTTGKELAEVPLVTHQDDPLLAHWQYGLGRTVAFTSDAKARWAADWLGWGKFAQFWAQVVRWSSRRVGAAGVRVQSEVKEDRAHLVVDAMDADGRFVNGLRFTGTVVTPANKEQPVTVEQTGPGRYEATFDVEEPGTHYLSLQYTDEEGRPALHTDGLVVPYSAEFHELGANEALMTALAQMTGGRVLAAGDDVFARTFPALPRWRDAWPMLLLVAALLVPADVFVRRVFVDWGAVWAGLLAAVRRLPVVGRRGEAARPAYVSALLGRKRRTREELARRGRKFEPTAEAPLEEPAAATGAPERRPEIARAAPRATAGAAEPAVEREEETYTGRLLRAKREARRRKDRESQDGKATS